MVMLDSYLIIKVCFQYIPIRNTKSSQGLTVQITSYIESSKASEIHKMLHLMLFHHLTMRHVCSGQFPHFPLKKN